MYKSFLIAPSIWSYILRIPGKWWPLYFPIIVSSEFRVTYGSNGHKLANSRISKLRDVEARKVILNDVLARRSV